MIGRNLQTEGRTPAKQE